MKLFLASRLVHPQSLQKLEEYVAGLAGKSIAYIPTAANGEGYGHWKDGESWQVAQTLKASITLVELEQFRSTEVIKELIDKDIIWVAGGMPGYLMYWMRRCEIDTHIEEILSKAIYVGSSAGSMVTAKLLVTADLFPDESEPGASAIPGLGLVDFDFLPHYDERVYDFVKERYRGNKLYLVKDGEALIVEDGHLTVFGEERTL